ncbi:unnamed protein product [Ectocarpus sp. 4 AP-2014]|uniref:EsV-1-105 n=1 Tax=Ectocarpus siliculosus virus 1 (isolate New Zealand/Kaikoura/1988) TaxID=654926 RepID=Q8QNH3_ESV1K|nr:EsV-1-105 [Ectocarpus siliculosus virus 1]AAK14523.1 EsV-1-105 [Ectocarpus siliculosus virus 1]
MFSYCIDMSRFFDFSLYRRTEERLRPAEKELSGRFHSTENVQLVYKRALSEIDSTVAYADVTSTMDAIFSQAIQTENLPEVSDMNNSVLRSIAAFTERANSSQRQFTNRTFTNSNVPNTFLPRPSYSSYGDEHELLRR